MIRTRKRKSATLIEQSPEPTELGSISSSKLQSQIDQLFKNYEKQQKTIREQTDSIECLTNDLKQTRALLEQLSNNQIKNKEHEDLVRFETVENHEDSADSLGEIGLAIFDAFKSPKKTVSQSKNCIKASSFMKTSQRNHVNLRAESQPHTVNTKTLGKTTNTTKKLSSFFPPGPEFPTDSIIHSPHLFPSDFDENIVEVHLEEDDDGYLQYPHMPGMADLYNCTITYRSSKIPNEFERRLAGYFFDLPPQTSFPEYYEICKNPMSLTIVKNRLRRRFYGKDLKMLYEDLMLIFRNGCYYYLKRDRLIYDGCKGIQGTLRRKLKIIVKQMGISDFNTSGNTFGIANTSKNGEPVIQKVKVNLKVIEEVVVVSDSETPEIRDAM